MKRWYIGGIALCLLTGWWAATHLLRPAPGLTRAQRVAMVYDRFKETWNRPGVLRTLLLEDAIVIEINQPELFPGLLYGWWGIKGVPLRLKVIPQRLPPAPGVMLLKADGTREERSNLHDCPPDYKEVQEYGWRFCNSRIRPQALPLDLMVPPIAGVPYTKALAILEQHQGELMELPGVRVVGLTNDGLWVGTLYPELVPSSVEELPVVKMGISHSIIRGL